MNDIAKQRVLLLYRNMIPSVRLCGHSQLTWLDAQGTLVYRARPIMRVRLEDLNWAETVLFCRGDSDYEVLLAQRLKQAGKRIGYIMDDDLLHVPTGLVSSAYFHQQSVQKSVRALLGLSDALLSPSLVLLDQYTAPGQTPILLEEPAIDPLPYTPRESGAPIRIGFAGSADRTGDIEQILQATLLRLHREYGNRVAFVFFGAVPSFAQALNAQCAPYCDSYDAYRQTLNGLKLDIGLAPMPDTPFHACKHYNKFVEYAASGIVGIFSDVKPYDRLRTQFGWELLCPNDADAWYHALKTLIDDPQALDALRQRVTAMAANEFSVPVTAKALHHALSALRPGNTQPLRPLPPLAKQVSMVRRGMDTLRRYGLRLPAVILRKVKSRLKR